MKINSYRDLTTQERLLISYFRAMRASAQHMMVDLFEEVAEALPAAPAAQDSTVLRAARAHQ